MSKPNYVLQFTLAEAAGSSEDYHKLLGPPIHVNTLCELWKNVGICLRSKIGQEEIFHEICHLYVSKVNAHGSQWQVFEERLHISLQSPDMDL